MDYLTQVVSYSNKQSNKRILPASIVLSKTNQRMPTVIEKGKFCAICNLIQLWGSVSHSSSKHRTQCKRTLSRHSNQMRSPKEVILI